METSIRLVGGKMLAPDGTFEARDLAITDGRIVETPATEADPIDCSGYHLLPGIIDVHGDAFERDLHPRPGVDIAFPIAMGSVDRQLLANGITTAFHGLTVSWEPGARSLAAAHDFMAGLESMRDRLIANHRVQLRWETFAHDAVDAITEWLSQDPAPAIAFNDHATQTLETVKAGDTAKLERWAGRAGVSLDRYLREVEAVGARAPEVSQRIEELAASARARGAVMLAHDESSLDDRASNRALGMSISEFPLSSDVAADAAAKGEHVVMGAPNVLRGGSHKGHLSAEEAVGDGLCTILASDYYYPSLLHAAEHLVRRGVTSLSGAWQLISANSAAAMGLRECGATAPGKRADVVVVDCSDRWRLVHTIVNGVLVSYGR